MEIQKQESQPLGTRVLLFPLPFKGHIRPMFHLANALFSKGFSITIIQTRFNSPDPTEFPNFTFHFIDDGLSNKLNTLPTDPVELFSTVKACCSEPFNNCISQILNDSSDSETNEEPIACLVADISCDFAAEVADSFHLPRIFLRCGSVIAATVYESLPLLRQNGYFPVQESRLDEPVLELPPLKIKDLPLESHHDIVTAFVKAARTCTQGIICNAFDELEPSIMAEHHKDYHPIPIFPIGPLNKYTSITTTSSSTQNSISWLNTQAPKSVIYVSCGSVAKISEAEFREMKWGLANSGQPFLWVVRADMIINRSEKDELFPQGFLEMIGRRGRIMKWAPQEDVLAHPAVGGFWTHCGWNSTIEAISQGMPMICHPFFLDQKVNARYISDVWRIGLLLENGLLRKDIERAIKEVMVGKEGEEMRERAAILMEKANLCFKEGGSSYMALEKLTNHILSLENGGNKKGIISVHK